MLTSKQRAYLSSLANKLDPIVRLGKAGPKDSVSEALKNALLSHELVKVRFIDFKGEKQELAQEMAEQTDSELVRIIGHVALFYKQNEDPEKRQINLPR